jgi:hypothetical protein
MVTPSHSPNWASRTSPLPSPASTARKMWGRSGACKAGLGRACESHQESSRKLKLKRLPEKVEKGCWRVCKELSSRLVESGSIVTRRHHRHRWSLSYVISQPSVQSAARTPATASFLEDCANGMRSLLTRLGMHDFIGPTQHND